MRTKATEFTVRVKGPDRDLDDMALRVLRDSVFEHATIIIHEYRDQDMTFQVTPIKINRQKKVQS